MRRRAALLLTLALFPVFASGADPLEQACLEAFQHLEQPPKDQVTDILQQLLQALNTNADRPQVADGVFDGNPLAEKLLAFAKNGQLMNQQDSRLNQMGLLVPNGGLCASTCSVNLVGTMLVGPNDNFQNVAPTVENIIVQMYKTIRDKEGAVGGNLPADPNDQMGVLLQMLEKIVNQNSDDARYGAFVEDLLKALQPLIEVSGGNVGPITHGFENDMAMASPGGILYSTVHITDNAMQAVALNGTHAILIPKIDTINHLIYVSDPNRPNAIYARNYWLTPAGEPQFESLVSYNNAGPSYITIDHFQLVQQVSQPPSLQDILARIRAMMVQSQGTAAP
jgi:hypothetical protein